MASRPNSLDQNHRTDGLHDRLVRIERALEADAKSAFHRCEETLHHAGEALHHAEDALLPAWKRVTKGEPRWPVALTVVFAAALQATLPQRVTIHPRLLLPALELAMLGGLVIASPGRINVHSSRLRRASMLLVATVSTANVMSAFLLIRGLVNGVDGRSAKVLLAEGGAIWLTNVIVFALWYWEFDRGGAAARANCLRDHADFFFPQMDLAELTAPNWEPSFVDYFYLSFTNATAFSPTDVLPLTGWAKLTMLGQSALSLSVVILVISRAVNILN